jgi:hypothetical protein
VWVVLQPYAWTGQGDEAERREAVGCGFVAEWKPWEKKKVEAPETWRELLLN